MSLLVRAKHVWGHGNQTDAILIENGLIVAVGNALELEPHATEVHDYANGIIVPGFCDAHIHLAWLGENLTGCDLRNCTSSKDFLSRLSDWAKKLAPNEILYGYGWDERTWSDPQNVTAKLVDAAVPNNPAYLVKIDGHSYCANTKMLEKTGITSKSSDPNGGRIERDVDGNPTGLLIDRANDLVVGKLGKADKRKEFEAAFSHLLSNGITSVRTFGTLDNFLELGRLAQEPNGLPLRVCACLPCENIDWVSNIRLRTGSGSEFFWVGQIKMFADGSLGSRSALVSRPYPDKTYGIEIMSVKDMADITAQAHSIGMGVAIHAIGDVAAQNVARVMKMTNWMDTIEHLQCAMPETIKDIAKTEVPVISNPSHIPLDAEAIQVDWKELAHFTYPISSLVSAGVPVGFGSDAPVASVNPFHAVACATSRKGPSTKVVNGREAIGYATAMEIITERSAKIIGGPKRGKLEKGWLADLAITQDFRGLDPWECVNTKFLATYIGGRLAWTP